MSGILINCINLNTIDWTTIITGIATSFIASCFFIFIFTRLKPKIKISDLIAIRDNNGAVPYKIKVINKSRFPVINIKAELAYINYFQVPGGLETNSVKIVLNKSEIFSLDKFDTKAQNAPYTYMFVTTENILNRLIQNNLPYIRFKLSAIHSLSNIGTVFEKRYYANSFVTGDFHFGNNLTIE